MTDRGTTYAAPRVAEPDGAGVDGRNEGAARGASRFAKNFERILQNVNNVVKGKESAVRMALTCLFAEGHLLIEDVPGTGKTTMAKAMALSIDGTWQRVQFTPDLLPTDVTGVQIFNRQTNEFDFHPGGVFANIVIADEVNRASPKTQSALLEVMEEHQVTVDSTPYLVPRPFIVIATQNPIEHEGTYNLPEAQIDRFMMRMALGYPDPADEVQIIANDMAGQRIDDVVAVVSAADVRRMIALTDRIYIAPKLQDYIVQLTGDHTAASRAPSRCQPPGHAGARPRHPGLRRRQWPSLRHRRRHQGTGAAGAAPPHDPHTRGRAPGLPPDRPARRHPRQRSGAPGAHRALRC